MMPITRTLRQRSTCPMASGCQQDARTAQRCPPVVAAGEGMTPASATAFAVRDLQRDLQRSLTAVTDLTMLVEQAAAHLGGCRVKVDSRGERRATPASRRLPLPRRWSHVNRPAAPAADFSFGAARRRSGSNELTSPWATNQERASETLATAHRLAAAPGKPENSACGVERSGGLKLVIAPPEQPAGIERRHAVHPLLDGVLSPLP